MSRRLDPPVDCRTTDHSKEISDMRDLSLKLTHDGPASQQTRAVLDCAAALLEVHDATGISLDNWQGPRQLVEHALAVVGWQGTFLENGV